MDLEDLAHFILLLKLLKEWTTWQVRSDAAQGYTNVNRHRERQLVFSRIPWRETVWNSENVWRRGLETWKSFTTASNEKIKIIETVRQRYTWFFGSKKQNPFQCSLGQDFSAWCVALTRAWLRLDRWRNHEGTIKTRQRTVEENREQMKKY